MTRSRMLQRTQAVPHIVVLGAGYAGLMASLRLDRRLGRRGRITLVNADDSFVERIRLHQLAAALPLPRRPLAEFLRGTGVQLLVARAEALEPDRRCLTVTGADGARRELAYDWLIYALGSTVETRSVPGVAEHAFTLGSPSTARALAARLPALAASRGRIVVVGGGLTGIEGATELAERFPALKVTLVTGGELGGHLSRKARAYLHSSLGRLGVTLREQADVAAVEPDAVRLASGERLPADLCLWAGGFVAPPLAAAAGLATNACGQLLVDETLRVPSHPEILGAGDAATPLGDTGAPLLMGCKTAMPLGAHAADTVAALIRGRTPRPFRFGDTCYCISLGRRDALIQLNARDGTPLERVLRGRLAVLVKELICRFTVGSLRLTRRYGGAYRWLSPPRRRTARVEAPASEKRLAK